MGRNPHLMSKSGTVGPTIAALCAPLLFQGVLLAQEPSLSQTPLTSAQTAAEPAPPTKTAPVRAARLSFFTGAVEIGRIDNTAAGEPVPNLPLLEGTRITTGDYGQAEIEFEDGSVARLTPRTVLTLNKLSIENGASRTELELLAGLAYFELRQSPVAHTTVDAGGTLLTPLENLTVRISLENPPAAFAMLAGSAKLEHATDYTAELHAGESLRGVSDGDQPYFRADMIVPESWDSWNTTRDQGAADEADQRTAAREPFAGDQGYGWSDLDSHGTWYTVQGTGPGTGPVWQPENADEGFDPYGFGNWVYLNNSYVYASGYSWGWTPFHCGAWQYFGGFGWGWSPNSSCGRWGFGGSLGGVFLVGHPPLRFPPVVRPSPGPVHPKPIIPVHGPDGPRPAFQRGAQAQIAGRLLTPLPVIATPSARSESSVGQALRRDFPVSSATRQPILGVTSFEPVHRPVALPGTLPPRSPLAGRPPFSPGSATRPANSPPRSPAPAPIYRPSSPLQPPRPLAPAPAPRPAPAPSAPAPASRPK